jgi:hypothetical protein
LFFVNLPTPLLAFEIFEPKTNRLGSATPEIGFVPTLVDIPFQDCLLEMFFSNLMR